MLAAVRWCPLAAVAAGLVLAAMGLRPLFVDSGGLRLAGLGHPAFLAEVTLAASYACLIEVYRQGRAGHVLLLGVNLLLLLLTGARAPIACAAAVIGLSLLLVPAAGCAIRHRIVLALSVGAALPAVLMLADDLAATRVFNLLISDAGHLSGRDQLWPVFEAIADQSPWFGWGVGASNLVIPPDGRIARMLHTWAAHNEYLRILVDGGHVGRTLLILGFVAWVRAHTAGLPIAERRIMRLVFLALAAHAVTDNVLISSPACVLFAFAAAVFVRGRHELSGNHQFTLPASGRLA